MRRQFLLANGKPGVYCESGGRRQHTPHRAEEGDVLVESVGGSCRAECRGKFIGDFLADFTKFMHIRVMGGHPVLELAELKFIVG